MNPILPEVYFMVIDFGKTSDIDGWMELVREISWNFPGLETEEAMAETREADKSV